MTIVTNRWMVHSSGTKFYQIFEFKTPGKRDVTLTHHGSMSGGYRRPVLGGKTKIHVGAILDSKSLEKIKHGYEVERTSDEEYSATSRWWVDTFGAKLHHELHVAIRGRGQVHPDNPGADTDNEFAPSDIAIAARPASWGSW